MILQPVFKRIAVLGLIVGLMFSGVLIAISQGAPLQDSATSSQAVLPVELKPQAPEELFPFWIPIPSADGSQIQLIALNVENQGDAVVESNYQPAITDEFDPSSYQWSHTGSYSSTIQGDGYISFATVPIGVNLVGDITMTVNSELVTNNMELNRYYISSSNQSPLEYDTKDGGFELSIPNEDTFATDEIYLTLMVNDFRPIDFLAESRPITKIYSVYSSSADLTTEKPILLQFNYNSILLGDADPFMLGVYRWSPNGDTWLEEDGTLFSDQSFFSLGTTQMGTFVVLVGPRWKDSFDDLKGISNDIDNVTLSRNGRLLLQPAETEGYAISRPITPTTLASWDTLTFDAIVEDEGTSVTVDILNAATGQTIMSDVTSGADISGIDPSANPAVQLRVSFTRSETSQTVALGNWQVSWTGSPDQLTPTPTETPQPTVTPDPPVDSKYPIYLPVILN